MFWTISRTLIAWLAMAIGATLGWLIGNAFEHSGVGAWVGAGCACGLVVLMEALRTRRLLVWLRTDLSSAGPRDGGHWGEIAYRVEKAVRARDRSVEAEREQLAQFLSGIEASPNGVMLLNAHDQMTWCNSVAAEHFGLDPKRDLLQRLTNLIRFPAFVGYLQAEQFDDAMQLVGLTGKRTLTVQVRPYGVGMKLVLSSDTSEREQMQAMQRNFVANVSHEIRTPLTVLAGFIESMATLKLDDGERKRVLELMALQATRMETLVGDLLALAKLEGSARPALKEWISISALIRRAQADGLALSRGRHELILKTLAEGDIAGDEQELLSAIGNLLSNAIRYTPEGGRIQISWCWRDEGGADLSVIDDGPGIAREHLSRLTERFYRVDDSRSRETGGTGLGLAIVKHVMLRLGGEVTVASELGKGSSFTLVIPAHRLRRSDDVRSDLNLPHELA